jgi:hypothetical protein
MSTEQFAVSTFCMLHNIDRSFIHSLANEGMITVTYANNDEFIEEEQLYELELFARWYQELGINLEGIDVIRHLVERVKGLQGEIAVLKSRLRSYEERDVSTNSDSSGMDF